MTPEFITPQGIGCILCGGRCSLLCQIHGAARNGCCSLLLVGLITTTCDTFCALTLLLHLFDETFERGLGQLTCGVLCEIFQSIIALWCHQLVELFGIFFAFSCGISCYLHGSGKTQHGVLQGLHVHIGFSQIISTWTTKLDVARFDVCRGIFVCAHVALHHGSGCGVEFLAHVGQHLGSIHSPAFDFALYTFQCAFAKSVGRTTKLLQHILIAHEQDQFGVVHIAAHAGYAHAHVQAGGLVGVGIALIGIIGPVYHGRELGQGLVQGHGWAHDFTATILIIIGLDTAVGFHDPHTGFTFGGSIVIADFDGHAHHLFQTLTYFVRVATAFSAACGPIGPRDVVVVLYGTHGVQVGIF